MICAAYKYDDHGAGRGQDDMNDLRSTRYESGWICPTQIPHSSNTHGDIYRIYLYIPITPTDISYGLGL